MKTQTAMNIIFKESIFLNMSIVEVMKDVLKHGRMMYSDRVVQAVQIVANI